MLGLALWAVLFYGLAPAFACLAGRAAAPAACGVAPGPNCACKADAHGKKTCCCASNAAEGAVCRLACSEEPASEGGLWTTAYHLPTPSSRLVHAPAPFAGDDLLLALLPALSVWPDLRTPPPRTPALG